MELKDKLKKLRTERRLSQQALADAIFISRSAVAKWENGLGLPNSDSLKALAEYFNVPQDYFTTEKPEQVILQKNKTIRDLIFGITASILAIAMMALVLFFPVLIRQKPMFTLSSRSAAGAMADNPCIHTEQYDFYLGGLDIYREDTNQVISYFVTSVQAVEQLGFLYRTVELEGTSQPVFSDGMHIYTLVSLPGENGYHNFLYANTSRMDLRILDFDTVQANGQELPAQKNCYFFSTGVVDSLEINNVPLELGEKKPAST